MINARPSKPPTRFVLVALPGTGKTTACQEIAKTLKNSKLADLHVLSVDKEIKKRFSINDPVIINFMREHPYVDKYLFTDQFEGSVSSEIMKTHGEPIWRQLEGDFCIDIMNQPGGDRILDLGGKMFLNDGVRKTVKNQSMASIFLYADRNTVERHLSNDDAWTKRSNYRDAGPLGWKALLDQHRQERSPQMIASTDIAIDISEMQPHAVAKEILYRIHEFKTLREKNRASYGLDF